MTAVDATGQSAYSADASAQTWVAPSFPNGANTFLLSSGALFSGPVNATAGLTTQLSLLVGGNPLTFAVLPGAPSGVAIDSQGVVTYTPTPGTVGPVAATFTASNALGSVTQTIQFNVAAAPNLPKPKLSLYATTSVYTGQYQQVSPRAVGSDGVTPVAGSFAIAYQGGKSGSPINAGTYQVLLTFTSGDAKYGNATLVTRFTITKATPSFSLLSAPTIAAGTTTAVVSGHIGAGTAVPAGDQVLVTLGGVAQPVTVDANGNFTAGFPTGALQVGNYTVGYDFFAGNPNFNAAVSGHSTLKVIPTAPPQVTLNPSNVTITAGDPVSFTVAATGSPPPTVQWQVSTDGGKTWTNITGNASATTTTLSFVTNAGENGDQFRAVFGNRVGSAISGVAVLTVEVDTGV